MSAIQCKGSLRASKASISLVFQGYEPELFKRAFKDGWINFEKWGSAGIIEESDSDSIQTDSDQEEDTTPKIGLLNLSKDLTV